MLILTIRTDKPEAELGLYQDQARLAYTSWQAHRELAETIHQKTLNLLEDQKYSLKNIDALLVFKGPGSFTGLRIGVSVANALAAGLGKPIVGAAGEDWQVQGVADLLRGQNDIIVSPEYGAPPHITQARK